MIIVAIIVGILIFALMILWAFFRERGGSSFDAGVFIGVVITMSVVLELCLISNIIEKPTPSALDVYQGKTTIEYTIRDGVKVDSVVVFKKELK